MIKRVMNKSKQFIRNNIFFYIKEVIKPKIFCISFQRTGTTSTGQFFKDHGYNVATNKISRKNLWTLLWFKGDYEKIFNCFDFKVNSVFEDDPWWCPDFYKFLFHRFPDSKFILLERDSNKWFDSMMAHSNRRTLGNTYIHTRIYRREKEFDELSINFETNLYSLIKDNLLDLNEAHRLHYVNIYEQKNKEIKLFFKKTDQTRLFNCSLEDPNKWIKMGDFFGIKVHPNYNVHKNKSMSV